MLQTVQITVEGAIDPIGTARTIRDVLSQDARLAGASIGVSS